MAHLEGILNGLTLIAVAAVLPRLRLSLGQQRTLGWLLIITAWGNTIASVIGPLFGGRGLEFGGGPANGLMYLLFVAAVGAVIVAMWLVFQGARRAGRD
jgi:cytosine/uracil/thiamine/allantoin permease